MMVDHSTSVDDDLALAASSSLWIGPQDVSKCDVSSSTILPKQTYPGLYDGIMSETDIRMKNMNTPTTSPKRGLKPASNIYKGDYMTDTNQTIDNSSCTKAGSGAGGVPGFPDFPAFWTGEEGGKRLRKKLKSQIRVATQAKSKQKWSSNKKRPSIKRSSVNVFLHRSRQQKQIRKEQKHQKRIKTLKRIEQKKQRKQDMAELNRKLSTFKFS